MAEPPALSPALRVDVASPLHPPSASLSAPPAKAGPHKKRPVPLKPLVVKNSTHAAPKMVPCRPPDKDAWWLQYSRPASVGTLGAHLVAPAAPAAAPGVCVTCASVMPVVPGGGEGIMRPCLFLLPVGRRSGFRRRTEPV